MIFRFDDGRETAVDSGTVLESHAVLRRLHGMSATSARALIDRIDRAASGEGNGVVDVHDTDERTLREALEQVERDGELTPALAALRGAG